MWDKVTPQEGLAKETELQGIGFWGTMIASGSFVRRHDRGIESARDVVHEMLANEPTAIKLQEELFSGKPLIQTDAGNFVNEEILKLRKKYQEELDGLKEEMGLAMEQGMCLQTHVILITDRSLGNKELQASLKAEYEKMFSQLEQQAEHQHNFAQVQLNNIKRRWQDADNERERFERELHASAARERDLRIAAERERENAQQDLFQKEREMEHELQMAAARERFEPARQIGGYEDYSRRREAGGDRDACNIVMPRPDSAVIYHPKRYTGPTWSETKSKPEKYNGQSYKTIECYALRILSTVGCGRPFDVVHPRRGVVRCCYCGKNWTLYTVNGRLRKKE